MSKKLYSEVTEDQCDKQFIIGMFFPHFECQGTVGLATPVELLGSKRGESDRIWGIGKLGTTWLFRSGNHTPITNGGLSPGR